MLEPATVAPSPTVADRQARRHWVANTAALSSRQPWAIAGLGEMPTDVQWTFGRDGFLTCRDAAGAWWAGCSLPLRAGEGMLRNLDLRGVVGCLLLPPHAGVVAAALAKACDEQAIVVVQPGAVELRVMLASGDFSEAILANRLWVAGGADWAKGMATLFDSVPGLPTPTQFIRTGATEEQATAAVIPVAEQVFQVANERRAQRVRQSVSRRGRDGRTRLLLVAPSHFRLWDDAGHALTGAMAGESENVELAHVDPDDPAQASVAGLAIAMAGADAVVVANRGRADLFDVVPADVAVINWVTEPRLPRFDAAHARDGLLLADEAWTGAAEKLGWPRDRVGVAGWPGVAVEPRGESLGFVADTNSLETPVTELELSSHHVLWEMIRTDLKHDPLSLGADVDGFLSRRMAKLGISDEGLNRAMFIQRLILPAYQQGLARILLEAGLPLRVYGRGWDEAGFGDAWGGRVNSRGAFDRAIGESAALVYAWPVRHRHAVDALGRGVVWHGGRDARQWVRAAREALARPSANAPEGKSLSRAGVMGLLSR